MNKILVINADPKGQISLSRQLTGLFIDKLKKINKSCTVSYRDIGLTDIPHISQQWVTAAFKASRLRTPQDNHVLQMSNILIHELKQADIIVLGTQMYNSSVPSVLEAYIDQILRVNETVLINTADPKKPYIGLLKNKKVYLFLERYNASNQEDDYYQYVNFQNNYLKNVFTIMGVENIEELAVNTSPDDQQSLIARLDFADNNNNPHTVDGFSAMPLHDILSDNKAAAEFPQDLISSLNKRILETN